MKEARMTHLIYATVPRPKKGGGGIDTVRTVRAK